MGRKETYTSGLRKLLFGEYRPENLLNRYRQEEGQLFHLLSSRPTSPADYLDLDPSLRDRWGDLSDSDMLKEWPSDYYFIPDDVPEPTHILSAFYRVYIGCELRLSIQTMLHKQLDSSIPVEVLRYELITLLENWLDLLIESHDRLRLFNRQQKKDQLSTGTRIEELQRYLWERLSIHLEISIYELQDRFLLIPNERRLTRRELYLKQFEQPLPNTVPYAQTLNRTKHLLQHLVQKEDARVQIDSLMNELQSEITRQPNQELRTALSRSLNLLQNARLCAGMRLSNKKGSYMKKTEIIDAEGNREHLSSLIRTLQEGNAPSDKEKEDLHYFLQSISEYRALFAVGKYERPGMESEAVKLIRIIDSHFSEPNSTGSSQDTQFQNHTQSERKNILDQYMDLDLVTKKIDVHPKTMKKYLDESGVEVIEFSQQRQLIHEDEVEKLLDYYKKKK